MATQTIFLGVFNNFIYDNQFFTKSNYNRNKHTHENNIIKSKGEILCNVAHIRKNIIILCKNQENLNDI